MAGMRRWQLLTAVFFSPVMAQALVIDDFTEGPLTISLSNQAGLVSQTGLDASRVLGGARYLRNSGRGFGGSVLLSIGEGAFSVSPQSTGYFDLMYGYDAPLNANFAAGGHDRIRLVFESVEQGILAPMWVHVGRTLTHRFGSAPGPGSFSVPSTGGMVEIPFSAYPNVDFSNVSTLAIAVVRAGSDFVIRRVETAGAPISGDYDRSGIVDRSDLEQWGAYFSRQSANGGLVGPDGNGNFVVDAADYTVWRDAYDAAQQQNGNVPEPGSIALLAPLLFCRGLRGRRSRA